MKIITKYVISVFFLATFYSLLATVTHAQQITLSISPPIIQTIIKPGKSILIAYTLKNLGDPAVLKSFVRSFTPKNNLGQIDIQDDLNGPVRFSLDNSVIKLDEPYFLKNGETQQLLLRIRIPDGAPEGDYYYTLLSQTQEPPSSDGSTASQARATIGSNILITITSTGNLELKGGIAQFDILSRFKLNLFGKKINVIDSSDYVPVVFVVNNTGNNSFQPQGQISLTGNFGEKANYDILPQNILAHSQRLLQAAPSADINCDGSKKSACQTVNSLVLNGFFIGRYRLNTDLIFGENTPQLSATTTFIALPLKIFLGIILAVGITLLIVKKMRD